MTIRIFDLVRTFLGLNSVGKIKRFNETMHLQINVVDPGLIPALALLHNVPPFVRGNWHYLFPQIGTLVHQMDFLAISGMICVGIWLH